MMFNLQTQVNSVTGEMDQLTGELQAAITDKEVTELRVLSWDITWEAPKVYIHHLAFILGPLMDKLHTKIIPDLTTLPREVGVTIKPTSRHTPKVTTPTDNNVAHRTELGKVDAANDASVVA